MIQTPIRKRKRDAERQAELKDQSRAEKDLKFNFAKLLKDWSIY